MQSLRTLQTPATTGRWFRRRSSAMPRLLLRSTCSGSDRLSVPCTGCRRISGGPSTLRRFVRWLSRQAGRARFWRRAPFRGCASSSCPLCISATAPPAGSPTCLHAPQIAATELSRPLPFVRAVGATIRFRIAPPRHRCTTTYSGHLRTTRAWPSSPSTISTQITDAVKRMQAACATSASNTPVFSALRQLETRMLLRAVAPLVALLLNSGLSRPDNDQEPSLAPPSPLHHSGPNSMLRVLQVTLLDPYYSSRNASRCSDIRTAVRAFGELRSLRVLHVNFYDGLCGLTPAELAALRPLADLRELCLTEGVSRDRSYDCAVRRQWAESPEVAIPRDDLLAFEAPLPLLRRLELVVPHYSFNRSRKSNARADFLAVLSASCPRLERLRLSMSCKLDSLTRARSTPAFQELRCLQVHLSDDAAVIRRGKP